MTEQETIKVFNTVLLLGKCELPADEANEAIKISIKALEEIQQYRAIGTTDELKQLKENGAFTGLELAQLAAMQMKLKEYQEIGTPEECRAAVEKMKPKKTVIEVQKIHICPICGFNGIYDYCGKCGQRVQMLSE